MASYGALISRKMNMGAERILILEDDADFARLLADDLKVLGQTRFTSYPERVAAIIAEFQPTLLIVDYNLNHPTLNGIKATRMVKQNIDSNLLPVLLLSGEDDMTVIEEAFKSGIDDYVLKPVMPRFLIAKIENLLYQTRKKLNAQSLSGLPGNSAIETEFYLRLGKKRPFAVAYTDLDNFKPFNDEKGVKRGDEAIQIAARILYELRAQKTRATLFVGHLGGDDFFLLGSTTEVRSAVRDLQKQFAQGVAKFFSPAEIKAGSYRGTDRQGRLTTFPLLTMSVAIVEQVSSNTVSDFLRLTEIAATAKKMAKKALGRRYTLDASQLPRKPRRELFTEIKNKSADRPKRSRKTGGA